VRIRKSIAAGKLGGNQLAVSGIKAHKHTRWMWKVSGANNEFKYVHNIFSYILYICTSWVSKVRREFCEQETSKESMVCTTYSHGSCACSAFVMIFHFPTDKEELHRIIPPTQNFRAYVSQVEGRSVNLFSVRYSSTSIKECQSLGNTIWNN